MYAVTVHNMYTNHMLTDYHLLTVNDLNCTVDMYDTYNSVH